MRESELYGPVKAFFEQRGFRVRGEVRDCDLCAELDRHVVAVELKGRLEMRLLEQAVERQRVADLVYLAVPVSAFAKRRSRRRQQERLIRRLEVGLLTVDLSGTVEPVFHPENYKPPRSRRGRAKLLKEISSRSFDGNIGGTVRRPRMTAYREQALKVAWLLAESGPASPRDLRERGADGKTTAILYRNHYGWFYRIDRGLYDVTRDGKQALENYPELEQAFSARSGNGRDREQSAGPSE